MKAINPVSWISRLFDNKKFLVAFSIICAVVFWLVIDITENPSRDNTISDISVPILAQEDDDGRQLVPLGEYAESVSVTVTVNGPGYIVSTVNKDDVSVSVKGYAEVSKPGTYLLTISATVNKTDCEVVSISPSVIQVVYDYNATADIPIEVDSSGYEPYLGEDCEIDTVKSKLRNDSDSSEISTIAVSGPSEIVSVISKAVAKPILSNPEISSVSQTFKEVELIFYDALGNEIDAGSLEYATEHYLRIVVYKRAFVKIVPTFVNMPPSYSQSDSGMPPYKIFRNDERAKAKTVIETIEVKGPAEKIDKLILDGINLSPIDFKQIVKNENSFIRSFVLDEGVEIVDGTEEVIVEIDFGGKLSVSKEISIDPTNIKIVNSGDKQYAVNYTGMIKITLCGNADDIKKIKAEHLTLSVDCASLGEDKPILVEVNPKYRAWMITINKESVNVIEK